MNSDLQNVTLRLLAHCREHAWAGYEPYDALNSELLASSPLLDRKLPRLVLTQFLKRSPINVRRLLRIPQTRNPKAVGLFLSSLVQLSRAGIQANPNDSADLVSHLIALRSPDTPYWCWGYNFPWQTRTVIVPRWAPNLVCTTFAATGLLDLFAQEGRDEYLQMALSAADYLLNDLYWEGRDGVCGFGYPLPEVHHQIHNANLLAAALFARIYKLAGREKYLAPALAATRYSVRQQRSDGGWAYGELPAQAWIDNFHTGFNLSALRATSIALDTSEFEDSLVRGFRFYRRHFFLPDGSVRYFHNRTYPLDTHCVAQSIITLLDLQDLAQDNVELAQSVYAWARSHMWNEKESCFYYRILPFCTIRTSYMRWTQAWMLLALSMLLSNSAHAMPPARAMSMETQPC